MESWNQNRRLYHVIIRRVGGVAQSLIYVHVSYSYCFLKSLSLTCSISEGAGPVLFS